MSVIWRILGNIAFLVLILTTFSASLPFGLYAALGALPRASAVVPVTTPSVHSPSGPLYRMTDDTVA